MQGEKYAQLLWEQKESSCPKIQPPFGAVEKRHVLAVLLTPSRLSQSANLRLGLALPLKMLFKNHLTLHDDGAGALACLEQTVVAVILQLHLLPVCSFSRRGGWLRPSQSHAIPGPWGRSPLKGPNGAHAHWWLLAPSQFDLGLLYLLH